GRQLDVAAHRVLDHARQLAAALDPAEGGAQPLAAGDQLERPGADLLARASHADDHALSPAAVRALERRAHHLDVADALEAVVHAPAGHLHDHLLDGPVVVPGVDAVGGAHFGRQPELVGIGVDGDDAPGLRLLRALGHRKTDRTEAEHRDRTA